MEELQKRGRKGKREEEEDGREEEGERRVGWREEWEGWMVGRFLLIDLNVKRKIQRIPSLHKSRLDQEADQI